MFATTFTKQMISTKLTKTNVFNKNDKICKANVFNNKTNKENVKITKFTQQMFSTKLTLQIFATKIKSKYFQLKSQNLQNKCKRDKTYKVNVFNKNYKAFKQTFSTKLTKLTMQMFPMKLTKFTKIFNKIYTANGFQQICIVYEANVFNKNNKANIFKKNYKIYKANFSTKIKKQMFSKKIKLKLNSLQSKCFQQKTGNDIVIRTTFIKTSLI